MRKKIFTFLLALAASVGMSWATTYVTITQNDFPESGNSFTKDGVTVSVGSIDRWDGRLLGGGSFSTTLGNFTHIEVMAGDVWPLGEGWSGDDESQIWSGNASSVSFNGDIRSMGQGITLLFTIGDPAPTYTVALKAGTVNADKVTLSATSAIEGATITVTPDEEYEITAFSAYYVVVDGQLGSIYDIDATLNPETGAYSFTMPAYDVTIEATIALKPVPEGDIYAGFTATGGSGGFSNEGSANLVDNKFTSGNEGVNWTKWCANDGHKSVPTGESESCWWIDFEASAALNPTGYILTTGNDTGSEHGRNPKNWVLKAKLNADDAWTTIATVTNDVTMKNKSFKDYKFFVDQSGTYQYFRFEVFANQGANVMQLCELRLIGADAPAPEAQIGPKEVLDLGTTGCVGEHYQLTGGGTNIYRTVGGVDNKMITIESLHGEIIDNISLKLYYYNVWTGYSVAASSGDVSSWNYDAYEDLVITNINATSVTLSRVGSGQENGYVMFEKVTINNSEEPAPTPTVWTLLAVGDVIKVGDKIEVPNEGDGSWGINGNVLRNAWGPYTLIRADIYQASEFDDPVVTETEDGAYYVFKAENSDFYPLSYLGKSGGLVVTTTSDGLVVTAAENKEFTVAVHDNGGATAIDEISQGQTCKSQKLIKDGQLLILRDGKTYTVTGQQVR